MRFCPDNKNAHFTLSTENMKKILIGGSPCTFWSIAQKERETAASGQGWELFLNYVIAKEKFRPDFFIYENNNSISKAIKQQITQYLGVENQTINSALVSAQERKREYWHNGQKVTLNNKGIKLQDIVESGIAEREKAYCLDASYYKGGNIKAYFQKHRRTQIFETEPNGKTPFEVKSGMVEIEGISYKTSLQDGYYYPRNMTVVEAARLQTMPDNYCKSVSKTQGIKCLGNGWTAEVIIEIMQHMNINKDEEIIVVSLYDGIATGRYCLDKLGYTNVKYYAYEIDKYAIQCALDNYADIVECGDAFQVREDDWFLTSNLATNGRKG